MARLFASPTDGQKNIEGWYYDLGAAEDRLGGQRRGYKVRLSADRKKYRIYQIYAEVM